MNRFSPANYLSFIFIAFQIIIIIYVIFYLIFHKPIPDSFYQQLNSNSNSFIYNMKTNGLVNPIGYDFGIPSLSWIVNTSLSSTLISSKVEISNDPDFKNLCHESPQSASISSIDYRVPIKLTPRTRYYWRVTVQTSTEKIQSNVSFFETSKMNEKWEANWITPEISDTFTKTDLPLVRKKIPLKKPPKKAVIYICGLGLYELYINGRKANNELFTPFYNGYDNWIQYQTYDITSLLTKGDNVVGVMLGDGWAKGRWGFSGKSADMSHKNDDRGSPTNLYVDKYVLISEIRVDFDEGQKVFGTDETWLFSKSEITQKIKTIKVKWKKSMRFNFPNLINMIKMI